VVPKRVLAAVACVTLVMLSTAAFADEYRAGELLSLDLSKAVLSPKPLGPPAEFVPVAVEARTDAKQVVVEPKADDQPVALTTRVTPVAPRVQRPRVAQARAEKPPTPARAKLARRDGSPLDAKAMDTRVQAWPCKSGGICNWKR
jgi:hypothetical protein